MKIKKFWLGYGIFVGMLLLLAIGALLHVRNILLKYESSQPERVVERYLEDLQEKSLPEELEILKTATELSYKVRTGNFKAGEQQFNILADDEIVAMITLESVQEEIVLAILTMCQWEVRSIDPVVFYNLKLPEGFRVYENQDLQIGVQQDGAVTYNIYSIYNTLQIEDAYGTRMEYHNGDSIVTYDYEVKIPNNYTLKMGDKEVSDYIVEETEDDRYQNCWNYAEMPTQVTYRFSEALGAPKIEVYNNKQEKVSGAFEGQSLEYFSQRGAETLPVDVGEQVDVLEIAQMWSKFMSKDLTGEQRGFSVMKEYLVEDSYLYDVAYKWSHGIDITYTASHILDDPPFTEERVTNYVDYGNGLFSCDISFVKHMYLTGKKMHVTDVTNSTFFFLYLTEEQEETGRWVIVDILEIIPE